MILKPESYCNSNIDITDLDELMSYYKANFPGLGGEWGWSV